MGGAILYVAQGSEQAFDHPDRGDSEEPAVERSDTAGTKRRNIPSTPQGSQPTALRSLRDRGGRAPSVSGGIAALNRRLFAAIPSGSNFTNLLT